MGTVNSSKSVAAGATTVVYASPCIYKGVTLTAAAAAATVVVYDNATAGSGTVVDAVSVAINSTQWTDIGDGVMCNNGITVVTTGAAAVTCVRFEPSA